MSTLRIFMSGPYTQETLSRSFAGALIAALEQAGAEVFYQCHLPTPETSASAWQHELYRRPVSIVLAPHSVDTAGTLPEEFRRLQSIVAFNPTRPMITIPVGYSSAAEAASLPYIPDFLTSPRAGTPERESWVIGQILALLALPSLSDVLPTTARGLPWVSHDDDPNNSWIHDTLTYAKALNVQGRHREAGVVLRQLAETAPQLAGLWTNLGYTYTLEEQWADGVEACQYAFGERFERTTSTRCLGTCLMGMGRYEDACAIFLHRALATHKNYGAAWLGLGTALVALGRFEEAHQAFDHVIGVNPNNPWAYEDEQNVAQAKYYLGNISEI